MTAPDFIWAEEPAVFDGMGFWQESESADLVQYVRRDPAVLLDLPEVQAAVAAAVMEAAETAYQWHNDDDAQELREAIRALITPDAMSALEAYRDREVAKALADGIERLADQEHRQWAHWTTYMLDNMTPENVARWQRQAATDYENLSDAEKESDRKWARAAIRAMIPEVNT